MFSVARARGNYEYGKGMIFYLQLQLPVAMTATFASGSTKLPLSTWVSLLSRKGIRWLLVFIALKHFFNASIEDCILLDSVLLWDEWFLVSLLRSDPARSNRSSFPEVSLFPTWKHRIAWERDDALWIVSAVLRFSKACATCRLKSAAFVVLTTDMLRTWVSLFSSSMILTAVLSSSWRSVILAPRIYMAHERSLETVFPFNFTVCTHTSKLEKRMTGCETFLTCASSNRSHAALTASAFVVCVFPRTNWHSPKTKPLCGYMNIFTWASLTKAENSWHSSIIRCTQE